MPEQLATEKLYEIPKTMTDSPWSFEENEDITSFLRPDLRAIVNIRVKEFKEAQNVCTEIKLSIKEI